MAEKEEKAESSEYVDLEKVKADFERRKKQIEKNKEREVK